MVRDEDSLVATDLRDRLPDGPHRPRGLRARPDARDRRHAGRDDRAAASPAAPRSITAICLLAAPEGIARVDEAFHDDATCPVTVVTAGVDERLDERGYITPGPRRRRRPALRRRLSAAARSWSALRCSRRTASPRSCSGCRREHHRVERRGEQLDVRRLAVHPRGQRRRRRSSTPSARDGRLLDDVRAAGRAGARLGGHGARARRAGAQQPVARRHRRQQRAPATAACSCTACRSRRSTRRQRPHGATLRRRASGCATRTARATPRRCWCTRDRPAVRRDQGGRPAARALRRAGACSTRTGRTPCERVGELRRAARRRPPAARASAAPPACS